MKAPAIRIIGHRGAASHAPENTLSAFEEGRRRGADWLETDVRCTADGVPVLLHDRTLDRTTNGSGPVDTWQAEALRALDAGSWFGRPEFAGQRVPTLEEALAWAAARGARLCLDIRGDLGQDAFEAIGRTVQDASSGGDTANLVLCGDVDGLRALLRCLPRASGGLLYGASDDPAQAVEAAKAAGASLLHPGRAVISAGMVDAAHQAGLLAGVYLPPDTGPERFRELAGWGVDVFNVDSPDTARRYLGLDTT
jgi:glycerophosphoryl diester phosphodiesterase